MFNIMIAWLRRIWWGHRESRPYCRCRFKWYKVYQNMACSSRRLCKRSRSLQWVSDCCLNGALSTQQDDCLLKPSWVEYWLLPGHRTLYIPSLIDHVGEILLIPNVSTRVQICIGIPRTAINHTSGTLVNQYDACGCDMENISVFQCKTAVTPVCYQWNYCSLEVIRQYII